MSTVSAISELLDQRAPMDRESSNDNGGNNSSDDVVEGSTIYVRYTNNLFQHQYDDYDDCANPEADIECYYRWFKQQQRIGRQRQKKKDNQTTKACLHDREKDEHKPADTSRRSKQKLSHDQLSKARTESSEERILTLRIRKDGAIL
jgi:hypothetical protein